jgi:hypothetical protein
MNGVRQGRRTPPAAERSHLFVRTNISAAQRSAPPVHPSNEQRCGSSEATSRFVISAAESHMSRETIKDRYQRTLGYIITEGSGRQKALDAAQRTLGYYYPQQDVTKDAGQRTIAHGNVLASLIYDAE